MHTGYDVFMDRIIYKGWCHMKKSLLYLLCILLLTFTGCSSEEINDEGPEEERVAEESHIPKFSDEYLVGFDYGGTSDGNLLECIDARVIIRTDHSLVVYMPAEYYYNFRDDYTPVGTIMLTDEQYRAIEKALDRERLYNMEVICDEKACDGDEFVLRLYGEDEEELKSCGGYMPTTRAFWEIYEGVMENIPGDEIRSIRDEYLEAFKGANQLGAYVGEHITLMGTMVCNMFAYDVTGDGYRDLCASVFTGSGIVTSLVVVYDVQNDQGYMLNDRGDYDYWIESVEDDRLIVTREEYGVYEYDTTVTGTIGFDEGVLYFVEDNGM